MNIGSEDEGTGEDESFASNPKAGGGDIALSCAELFHTCGSSADISDVDVMELRDDTSVKVIDPSELVRSL